MNKISFPRSSKDDRRVSSLEKSVNRHYFDFSVIGAGKDGFVQRTVSRLDALDYPILSSQKTPSLNGTQTHSTLRVENSCQVTIKKLNAHFKAVKIKFLINL